jgi:tyrosinase
MPLYRKALAIGLAAAAVTVAVLALGSRPVVPPPSPRNATASSTVRVRKNIDALTAGELKNLRHAFQILIDRSIMNVEDKSGYVYWARIHNDHRIGKCVHGSDRFLPWHRIYLAEFETLLRNADPNHDQTPTRDVTLPYWDWTAASSGNHGYPAAVEQAPPGQPPNNLYWPNPALCDVLITKNCKEDRNQHKAGQVPYDKSIVDTALGGPWHTFGHNAIVGAGDFEDPVHADMHLKYTGSDMGGTTAANDPLFWFFHANVDRLLQTWQIHHQKQPCQPGHPEPLSNLTALIRNPNGKWPEKTTVAEVVCIQNQLGYTYDHLHQVPATDLEPNAVPTDPDFALVPSPREGGRIAPAPTSTRLHFRFTVPTAVITRAYLVVPRLTPARNGGYQVRAYLHPSDATYRGHEAGFADRYYAGQTTVWNAQDGPPERPASEITSSINISRKLNQVIRATPKQVWVASVVITRLGMAPDGSPVAADAQPSIEVITPRTQTIPLMK